MAFGEAGEAFARFGKGERIGVLGRLQRSEDTDREGQKRTNVEVEVLRSDPAPLARKAENEPAPEARLSDAAEEPATVAEAPEQPTDAPARRPCWCKAVVA